MKLFKRIALCTLATALLLPSIHAGAEHARWHTKATQSLKKTTKQAFHSCKTRLTSLKSRIRGRWAERQLLFAFIITFYVAYLTCLFSAIVVASPEFTMPYTEAKLLRAFTRDNRATIDDYLDNKRILPNDFVNGEKLLLQAARQNSVYGVNRLFKMGEDPRMTIGPSGKTIVDLLREDCDDHSQTLPLLEAQARRLSSYGEKKCLEIVIKRLGGEQHVPPEILELIREFAAQT